MLDKLQSKGAVRPVSDLPTSYKAAPIQDLIRYAREYAWLIAVFLISFLMLGAGYSYFFPPNYLATAQILIEPQKNTPTSSTEAGFIDLTLNSAQVESQIEVLRSDQTLIPVIKELKLEDDVEFRPGESMKNSEDVIYSTMGRLSSHLDIRRVGQSYIIQLTLRHKNPARAAEIANAIAQSYVKNQLTSKKDAALRTRQWLESRLTQVQAQLHHAVQSAQEFRFKTSHVDDSKSQLDAEVTLSQLDSVTTTYRRMYEAVLQKLAETIQLESALQPGSTITVTASDQLARLYPRRLLVLSLFAMVGILLGIATAAILNMFDDRMKANDHLQSRLDLNKVGDLPKLSKAALAKPQINFTSLKSSEAQQIIRFTAAINLEIEERGIKTLGIVSADSGSGATTLSRALGHNLSEMGRRVLLVDANYINRFASTSLTKIFNADTDIVFGQDFENRGRYRPTEISKQLSVVACPLEPSSAKIGFREPESNVLQNILNQASNDFDVVIVDLPSLSRSTLPVSLSSTIDAYILVCRMFKDEMKTISWAADLLKKTGTRFSGCFVNEAG